jgi:hypothetical protein
MPRLFLAALLLLAPVAATAQVSQQPFFNVITLDASATAEVPTDTLTVTMFAEEQGPDPAALATRINTRLEQALARAKAETSVQTRSGSYQTNPVYDRANQITGWRIRAELILESRDFKAVSALSGQLQPALKVATMNFSLSRAAREKAKRLCLRKRSTTSSRRHGRSPRAWAFPASRWDRSPCTATGRNRRDRCIGRRRWPRWPMAPRRPYPSKAATTPSPSRCRVR